MTEISEVPLAAIKPLRRRIAEDRVSLGGSAATRWFAATDGGEIIGVGGLTITKDKGKLHGLWVDAGQRRRGVGTALIDRRLEECRACRVIETYAYNPHHYSWRGFAIIGKPTSRGSQRLRWVRPGGTALMPAMPQTFQVSDKIEMVPIKGIKPYQRNPRKNAATIDKLVELIPKVGFNVPLVIDRNNVIVKGHSRWAAAIRLGMRELPCVYTDADEETIRLDRLADNRVQEFSTWDEDMLKSELGALNLPFEFDLGTLNFEVELTTQMGEVVEIDQAQLVIPNGASHAQGERDAEAEGDDDPVQGDPPEEGAAGPALANPQYLEVICNNCGNHLFVKKD